MQREVLALLHDIDEAGRAILELAARHTYEDYRTQRWLRSSIEREFTIIGEAVNAALDKEPELPITDARDIIAFRNILVHRYRSVEASEVWGFVESDLPASSPRSARSCRCPSRRTAVHDHRRGSSGRGARELRVAGYQLSVLPLTTDNRQPTTP
jgi:uncharacterized protein with HEPN domain